MTTEITNVMDVVNVSPTTKEEAFSFTEKLVRMVKYGEVNPLELHIKLTAMEQAITDTKKQIAEYVLDEASKFGNKTFETSSAEVTIAELGAKYSFDICNDRKYNEAVEQGKGWAEKRKEREEFLKTIPGHMEIVDEGEVVTIHAPLKTSKTGVKITLL